MILGLGNDLVDIRRIERLLEKFGRRFERRVFTEMECAQAASRHDRVSFYAKRFAAKEAFAKALGTGFRDGLWLRDVGVVSSPEGKPKFELTGEADARLQALAAGRKAKAELSLADEYPYAQAVVVLWAL